MSCVGRVGATRRAQMTYSILGPFSKNYYGAFVILAISVSLVIGFD